MCGDEARQLGPAPWTLPPTWHGGYLDAKTVTLVDDCHDRSRMHHRRS